MHAIFLISLILFFARTRSVTLVTFSKFSISRILFEPSSNPYRTGKSCRFSILRYIKIVGNYETFLILLLHK